MKINQEDSIKLYLRIKPPQIIDEPYYSIDKTKSIFTLKNRGHKKNDENILSLNLSQIFDEDDNINDIYNKTCKNVIKESLSGCSFCFINHGETISDKLNTLLGDIENNDINNISKGIFQCLIIELINYIEKNKKEYNNIYPEFSFSCIYNSRIIDLNNYLGKDTSNLNIDDLLKNSKLIQKDKNIINSFKKIPITISNNSTVFYYLSKLFFHLKKINLEFFSNSYFTLILYITKKIKAKKIRSISSITFLILNGSEKLNIIENIKLDKNKNTFSSDIKKKAINASKISINTQNNYNSIIYLIRQNKIINIEKNKNLDEDEIKEIEYNEGRYLSNVTTMLYKICFDYNIENIKYYIFANIYPNIGFYQSIKDSIMFLFDLSKILNKNIKNIKNLRNKNKADDLFENKFMLDLENKINQQEQAISALSEICQSKNEKINNIHKEYNSQINKLKNIFGFKGDIQILLSGDNSPEFQRAKNMRESTNRIKTLNSKVKSMEKLLKISEEEIDKYKSNEDVMKNDIHMLKYLERINSMKDIKLNEMKMKSFYGQKLNELEKELNKKDIIINKLKQDLESKNIIIQNFSNFSPIKNKKIKEKNDEKINNIIQVNDKTKDKKDIDVEKIINNYEKKLKEEKDFWISTIEEKDNQIKKIKNQINQYKSKQTEHENNINKNQNELEILNKEIINKNREINYKEQELMKLNEFIMEIIYKYNSDFIHKSKTNKDFIKLNKTIDEFNIYITEKEKEINQLNFPILHTLLEKNNKLSTNYKIKSEKNIKINKEISKHNNNEISKENTEMLLTQEHLEQMDKNKLIDYCLKLNKRIINAEKYKERFQEIKLENEKNKKQILYLKYELKKAIKETEKTNNNIENFDMPLSPKKTLHFNKSQINLKTYIRNSNYSEMYNNKNRNKNNKIFLKNETDNKGINKLIKLNKNLKELQIPFNYFRISSDNKTIDTNNNYYNDGSISIKSDKGQNKNKNMFKNKFSASYTNFFSNN